MLRVRPYATLSLFALTLALLLAPSCPAGEMRPLVLVELFTSEGCSSCPSADKLLAELYDSQPVDDVTIVPMAFHVDYWDRLGWKDPFGDASYSRRQRAYAGLLKSDSVYTPQMIVNGTEGFVGSDRGAAQKAIAQAGKAALPAIEVAPSLEGGKVNLALSVTGVSATDGILWAAVVEDGLESDVKRGENSGRQLKHQAVVRTFQGEAYVPAASGEDKVSVGLPWSDGWKAGNCRVIVAIQSKATGQLYALGQASLDARK